MRIEQPVVGQHYRRGDRRRGLRLVQRGLQFSGEQGMRRKPERVAKTGQRGAGGARELDDHRMRRRWLGPAQHRTGSGKSFVAFRSGKAWLQHGSQRVSPGHQQALDVGLDALVQFTEFAQRVLARTERSTPLAPQEREVFEMNLEEACNVASARNSHFRIDRSDDQLMDTVPARMRWVPLARTRTSSPRIITFPSDRSATELSPHTSVMDRAASILRCSGGSG